MKRSIADVEELDHGLTMANCLMLLSRGINNNDTQHDSFSASPTLIPSRVFECKTCNRQFPSFQVLGGHRASHKKPRLTGPSGDGNSNSSDQSPSKGVTTKAQDARVQHMWPRGRRWGGHMRRHGAALRSSNTSSNIHDRLFEFDESESSACATVGELCLDLNLTPLENDLEILRSSTCWVFLIIYRDDRCVNSFL
ncbi:hypothetical protein DVH24_024055 [Malus domestica]|uniref:C2H2-type domain-containing protein n=1 Tax=Malus domestica TaxID=3750 RepID=A0A498JM35_MALDO|nr:hypothetical protein DVH24_024055 [Malus domestica]